MSTDYGFRCIDCKTTSIVDNLRGDDVPLLQSVLANIDAITKVQNLGLHVSIDGSYYNFGTVVSFAAEHLAKQHLVAVSDEYGRVWGLCREIPTCPHCKQLFHCTRDDKHDGECSP